MRGELKLSFSIWIWGNGGINNIFVVINNTEKKNKEILHKKQKAKMYKNRLRYSAGLYLYDSMMLEVGTDLYTKRLSNRINQKPTVRPTYKLQTGSKNKNRSVGLKILEK